MPRCELCGGKYEDGVCMYCGNKLSIDFIESLQNLIKPFDNVTDYYENIRKKLYNGIKLELNEDKAFCILLKNKMIIDDALDDARILSYIMYGNKIISYETFEELILRTTEKNMRQLNNNRIKKYNPYASVSNLEEANGSAFEYTHITFDKLIIKELYEGFKYPLSVYYHEIHHIAQNLAIKLGYINNEIVNMIKDFVIRDYELRKYKTNNYYKDNYYNITFEKDAHEVGINFAYSFYKIIGFENLENYFDNLKNRWPNYNDFNRIIRNDKEKVIMTLDDVFETVINLEPKYLDIYPQLKFQYINENGKVRKRTKEELFGLISAEFNDEVNSYLEQLINNLEEEKIKK